MDPWPITHELDEKIGASIQWIARQSGRWLGCVISIFADSGGDRPKPQGRNPTVQAQMNRLIDQGN